ncbi:hypothetical protein FACS1894125_5670 [Actinomycetota bacterium]|nr:hypothetical protein FACS1894125_5670 [Actinomycetota bacterium]
MSELSQNVQLENELLEVMFRFRKAGPKFPPELDIKMPEIIDKARDFKSKRFDKVVEKMGADKIRELINLMDELADATSEIGAEGAIEEV